MIVISVISTKGGVGKTTTVANLGGLLAHLGFNVLLIDGDDQPSLSKYFPLSFQAPNGLEKVIRESVITDNEISEITIPAMELEHGGRPVLDIIYSDAPEGEIQSWLMRQGDRVMRLKYPLFKSSTIHDRHYDFILIDTHGGVTALQEAAIVASSFLISPVTPETLAAREFIERTLEVVDRLSRSALMMNIELGHFRALIYRQTRTVDSRTITQQIRENFIRSGGKIDALNTTVPSTKAYTEATTYRVPVHLHDFTGTKSTPSAYEVMHRLIYEIVPMIGENHMLAPVYGANTSWLDNSICTEEGVAA